MVTFRRRHASSTVETPPRHSRESSRLLNWLPPRFRPSPPPLKLEPAEMPRLALRAGSRCVTGSRSINQDRCYADAGHGVFLVADGMGGHYGGAEASRMLVSLLPPRVALPSATPPRSAAAFREVVTSAILRTARCMRRRADQEERYLFMGATMALAVVDRNRLHVCHVGDCRVYLWRNGVLRRLTVDETLVQALVNGGVMTESEAARDPRRNLVLNSVNARFDPDPLQTASFELHAGDRILVCSDGLTDSVDDAFLQETLALSDPQEAVERLVREAVRDPQADNVGCIVVKATLLPARQRQPDVQDVA